MLILSSDQIKYCQLILDTEKGEKETYPGLVYQGKCFMQQNSYPKDQAKQAIVHCRQAFLDNVPNILCLVIEDDNGYTLFSEDPRIDRAQIVPLKKDKKTKINYDQILGEMRNLSTGIEIKDRRYRLRVYPRCFTGADMVTWIVQNYGISREEAVGIGQKLVAKKIIHHVVDEHDFEDGFFFYRFYMDEQTVNPKP